MEFSLRQDSVAGTEDVDRPSPKAPSLPGEASFWTFIAADATLFALLFFQFSVDRASHVAVFATGQRALLVQLGAANTLVLVTSSWFVALAVRAAHGRDPVKASRWLGAAALCGIAFAFLKVAEYVIEFRSGHTLSTSPFFMYYYVITGLHLLHLLVGVVTLVIVGLRLPRDTDPRRNRVILECTASYWHLIDLLWMFIFPLIYLAR